MIASFFNYIVGYNQPNDTYNNANNKIDTLKYNSIKLPYELVNIILEYDGRIKYKYNWSANNAFEICYTDMKGSGHVFGSDQIRTYI